MAIKFKYNTKKFSKPSLEELLNTYAEETGMIEEKEIKDLLNHDHKDELTKHLVEWNKLIDNAQDDEALKKADEIRRMIRGQKEFSNSGYLVYHEVGESKSQEGYQITTEDEFKRLKKAAKLNDELSFKKDYGPDSYQLCQDWIKDHEKKFSKLRRFSDDKMLFVEYVDEDGDTTHQVMKKSEFDQVKDEAKINRASGAKLKILTEESYDENNPKHKKYKDHPVTETKEFSEDREVVPDYIAKEVDENGVIVKYKDSWRIVSKKQKPYEFWDAHYDTKEDAEDALAAYHANK